MINLQLSVREAMELAIYAPVEMRERITQAFEVALGVNQRCTVTITGGMNLDNRIKCIKAIRLHSGWDLKTAKDWTDYLVGGWKYDKFVPAYSQDSRSSRKSAA
jgi:ribosomal protein L7/L12